jgi:hypothetical protein
LLTQFPGELFANARGIEAGFQPNKRIKAVTGNAAFVLGRDTAGEVIETVANLCQTKRQNRTASLWWLFTLEGCRLGSDVRTQGKPRHTARLTRLSRFRR